MTTNQKILIALGLGAVAFYVYKMRGNKGQGAVTEGLPTTLEVGNKPSVNNSVVVDLGKNPIRKDPYGMPIVNYKWDPEAEDLNFAKLKKYGAKFNLAKEGDRLTTKYGTYEYRRKPTGGALGKGFTTTWEKI